MTIDCDAEDRTERAFYRGVGRERDACVQWLRSVALNEEGKRRGAAMELVMWLADSIEQGEHVLP